MASVKLAHLASMHQVCGGSLRQQFVGAPRHAVLSAQPVPVTLQADSDHASVQGPASKIGMTFAY